MKKYNPVENDITPDLPDELADDLLASEIWQDPALLKALKTVQVQNGLSKITPFKANKKLTWSLGLAASLVCVMLLNVKMSNETQEQTQVVSHSANTIKTQKGERSDVLLQDGTNIWLNADSKLSFKLVENKRLVKLEKGEAFFDVAKDKDRPFMIETKWGDVTVVGTSFNMDITHTNLEVSVTEGRVAVTKMDGQQVFLLPGDGIKMNSNGSSERFHFSSIKPIDWKEGVLRVENNTLAYVSEKLNRYSTKPVYIDPQLAANRVTGTFILKDVNQTVILLSQLYNLKLIENNDNYFLTSKKSS